MYFVSMIWLIKDYCQSILRKILKKFSLQSTITQIANAALFWKNSSNSSYSGLSKQIWNQTKFGQISVKEFDKTPSKKLHEQDNKTI